MLVDDVFDGGHVLEDAPERHYVVELLGVVVSEPAVGVRHGRGV